MGNWRDVEPDLGENDLRESRADAGNLVESLDRGRLPGAVGCGVRAAGRVRLVGVGLGFHRGEQFVDADGQGGDLGVLNASIWSSSIRVSSAW